MNQIYFEQFTKRFTFFCVVFLCVVACNTTPPVESDAKNKMMKIGTSTLSITFHGLRPKTDTGKIFVALWDSPETFMKDGQWVRSAAIPIALANEACVMPNLPTGTFAVSSFYDVTNCDEFRRGAFGIPIDPWAISNGGPPWMPPNWNNACFKVGEGNTKIELDFEHLSGKKP
ncbi:MAG: DUF2141 domain-containing protein [Planctomycetota bacterium]|nr:DUF2141 domain-containing protein [Planctomycetota bacterium]MDA1263429.1 DUF2141 domain-containing protein [Planctomycetota bacterium]